MDQLSAARSPTLNGKSAVLVVHCHLSSSRLPPPTPLQVGVPLARMQAAGEME